MYNLGKMTDLPRPAKLSQILGPELKEKPKEKLKERQG